MLTTERLADNYPSVENYSGPPLTLKELAVIADQTVESALAIVHDGLVSEPDDWVGALCPQVDPEIFFPEKGPEATVAKRICARCLFSDECLAYALTAESNLEGIWGGIAKERRAKIRLTLGRVSDVEAA